MDTLEVCRLCGLNDQIMINIFEPGSEFRHYIHSLLPIWISDNDNLPRKLCYRCVFKLQEFYAFREQCIYVDIVLKKRHAKEDFESLKCSEEMCVEKQCEDGILPQGNEEFEVTFRSASSDAPTVEIITINSRSPSPASDGTSLNATISTPTSNCNNSAVETENSSEGQKCKRIKKDEHIVFLHIPDENANIDESGIVDSNCYSVSVNRPKGKNSLVVGRHSENYLPCTEIATETGNVTYSHVKPTNGAVTELGKNHKSEEVSNAMEIGNVKQISEKCNVSSYNSTQTKGVPENIIVTKIPGLYNVYTCSFCERTFVTRESAVTHNCDVQPVQSEKTSYECEICSRAFSRHATLLAHQKRHICDSSDEDF